MSSAVQSALAGLVTAGQRLEKSAAAIARGGLQPAEGAGQAPRSQAAARPGSPLPAATVAAADPDAPSLTDGLFAMKQAEIQYKASAKLLGLLNDMRKDTLDRLG